MTRDDTGNTLVYPLQGIKIDAARLRAELDGLDPGQWVNQNRYRDDVTNWKGICLYSITGATDDLRCADRVDVKKTPAGERCPYVCNEILPQFNAPWFRVAFYRLKAGTKIGEHRDYGQTRSLGMVRIHIPVITSENVLMYVDRKPYHFAPGEAWYFDASALHAVENNSEEDRIHLIVDFKTCPGLDAFLKPITMNDRLRHVVVNARHKAKLLSMFLRYVRSAEGRARIKARLGQVLRTG